ncbi:helix-turn-helix domain-containing protein [Streptomyces sp. NPDC005302]|uniref:helix-turn-helix domain-containing protein n=1 Tax=Streptomyces sp. NPDC005302 TaxID=3154675 RepID=UPI0033AE0C0A
MSESRQRPPVQPLAAELFAKIRTLRKLQGMSVQKLADRMNAQGFKISRSQVASCEIGYRRDISVDFADHAARALGLTLVQLLFEPAVCQKCKGAVPEGFTCNACGTAGGAA